MHSVSNDRRHKQLAFASLIKDYITHGSLVVLGLGAKEAVDLLHGGHLYLQVGQVPHHPVQVVGHLGGGTTGSVRRRGTSS